MMDSIDLIVTKPSSLPPSLPPPVPLVQGAHSVAFAALSVAEKMALCWCRRMLLATRLPKERTLLLRMDQLLATPAAYLRHVAAHFGLPLSQARAADIVAGPVWSTYAKDSSVPWNATVQRTLLEGRATAYRPQVREGVAFAASLIAEHPELERLADWVEL